MTDQKLTPWFVKGEVPTEPGVYNVSCKKRGQSGDWWSYWDGERFCSFRSEPDRDLLHRDRISGLGLPVKGSWRGLAQDPNKP